MGGLAVFFLIGLYFFIAYKIIKAIKSKHGKWLAIVILALVPTADAVVGRVFLKNLCATDGGMKVNRVVKNVKGYMDYSDTTDHAVRAYGFEFVESAPKNGVVFRYSKQSGRIVIEEKVKPKSLYQVRYKGMDNRDAYPRYTYDVVVISTGEVLASYTNIGFSGGWAERFLSGFSDAGRSVVAWCGQPVNPSADVVISSLKTE